MIFRVHFYPTAGAHVRCTLFVAPAENRTFASCGQFTVRRGEEFAALVRAFSGAEFIGNHDSFGIMAAASAP